MALMLSDTYRAAKPGSAKRRPRPLEHRGDSSQTVARCLMIQTEHPQLVHAAVKRLRTSDLYPGCTVLLVCREEDAASFEDLPDVELLTYSQRGGGQFPGLWQQISKFRADAVCAVFCGRPVFRKQKLLFFLLPVRRRVIFDARAQAYPLRVRNIVEILRSRRHRPNLPVMEETILYLPTEEDSIALKILGRLQDPKIVGPGRILVLCSEAKRALYEARPDVDRILAYEPGHHWANLRRIWRLARMRVDVIVAILADDRIFRPHKHLFLALPARSRLAFNEHGECRYVKRSLLGFLRALWRGASVMMGPSRPNRRATIRKFPARAPIVLKVLLFFPRYLFLILWLLLGCLRPGGSKRLIVFRKRNFGRRDWS